MKRLQSTIHIALAGIATTAAPALAQEDLFGTFVWEVATLDGDAIVEPGETAEVTILLDLTPDVITGDGFGVWGIAALIVDTLAGPGAANGHILGWRANINLTWLTGDLTTTDGVSLFNSNFGQWSQWPCLAPEPGDPSFLLTFDWQPLIRGSYDVHYQSSTSALQFLYGDCLFANEPATPVDTQVTFEVALNCPADANGDGALDSLDFVAFQTAFLAGDFAANCNADDTLDVLDLVCFQHAFQEGCP